jgi:hypothetical protein
MTDGTAAYVERYRWTASMSLVVLICLAFIIPMVLTRPPLILEIPVVGMLGWGALYSVVVAVSRKVAFRVDERGVTLGGGPFRYQSSCRFFAWDDIEAITVWQRYFPVVIGRRALFTMGPVRYVGLQRRPGARSITHGRHGLADRPAHAAPAGTIAAGAARNITAWVLDRDRLTEVVAAWAPAVRIETGVKVATPWTIP